MNISLISKSLRAFLVGIIAVIAFGSVSTALAAKPLKVNFGPDDILGFLVADCGDFNVLLDFTVQGHFIVHFDKDDNPVRVNEHFEFPNDVYYNSESPEISFTGNAVQNTNVDLVDNNIAIAGLQFKLTVPGQGVVFHEVGRLFIDLNTGDVLMQAGPADFSDGNTAALCAALTP